MALRKRIDKRRPPLTPIQWAFLNDAEERPAGTSIFEWIALKRDVSPAFKVRDLWAANRDAVLAEWIAKHPGHRPSLWWRYDSPEPRHDSEPQAAYLERHGLFMPGERRRLTKTDFE
jgi:hypothetical protein